MNEEESHGTIFLQYIKKIFSSYFHKKKILNTGAYNLEHDKMFNDCTYYSSDLTKNDSKMRELVSYKNKVFMDKTFDMIVSIECLENDEYYEESLKNLYDMLKPDGLLVIGIKYGGQHAIDIHKLHQLLKLHKNFVYWNCYKTTDNYLLFVGMKTYILLPLFIEPTSYINYENNNQMVVSIKSIIVREN